MMRGHQLTETYAKFFNLFLSHTNEKEILFDEIKNRVLGMKVKSLLDIGAGNGELAVPVSRLVENYTAIEQRADYVSILSSNGLDVIENEFPCEIDETFDFILASHVLYWKKEKQAPFFDKAHSLLNDGGTLLVITYDDQSGDWYELVNKSGLETKKQYSDRLDYISSYMSSLGKFKKSVVVAKIKTENLEDMMGALAFVWSDGTPEKIKEFLGNENVKEFLENKYKVEGRYVFPFNHIFLELEKRY